MSMYRYIFIVYICIYNANIFLYICIYIYIYICVCVIIKINNDMPDRHVHSSFSQGHQVAFQHSQPASVPGDGWAANWGRWMWVDQSLMVRKCLDYEEKVVLSRTMIQHHSMILNCWMGRNVRMNQAFRMESLGWLVGKLESEHSKFPCSMLVLDAVSKSDSFLILLQFEPSSQPDVVDRIWLFII